MSAFANCGRAIAHVRGSYGLQSDSRSAATTVRSMGDWSVDMADCDHEVMLFHSMIRTARLSSPCIGGGPSSILDREGPH